MDAVRSPGSESRRRHVIRRRLVGPGDEDEVGASGRLRPFPEATGGQRPIGQVAKVEAEQVEIAEEPQVLKPVVEHVDPGAEAGLDHPAHPVATATHGHDDTIELTRQHDRLVAGGGGRGEDAPPVADHERVAAERATIPTAEHRHRKPRVTDHRGHVGHHRRLAAPSDAQVADADHRPLQAGAGEEAAPVGFDPEAGGRAECPAQEMHHARRQRIHGALTAPGCFRGAAARAEGLAAGGRRAAGHGDREPSAFPTWRSAPRSGTGRRPRNSPCGPTTIGLPRRRLEHVVAAHGTSEPPTKTTSASAQAWPARPSYRGDHSSPHPPASRVDRRRQRKPAAAERRQRIEASGRRGR
jgi:hypothetical protein